MKVFDGYWLALGLAGQIVFTGRFLLQWLYSEKRGESLIPMTFWYASIIGGAVLLVYAIHLRDPVFITGQAFGVVIYLRNVQLRLREARKPAPGDMGS
jgi:lipid-A-disaccharide synthase-like uncharacterized protein